jgi:hypothetical protein
MKPAVQWPKNMAALRRWLQIIRIAATKHSLPVLQLRHAEQCYNRELFIMCYFATCFCQALGSLFGCIGRVAQQNAAATELVVLPLFVKTWVDVCNVRFRACGI